MTRVALRRLATFHLFVGKKHSGWLSGSISEAISLYEGPAVLLPDNRSLS